MGVYSHFAYGTLSAVQLCVLCHLASAAGLKGLVARIAKPAGAPSGHYQRHLNKVLGFDKKAEDHYELLIPGRDIHSMARTTHRFPALLPHELLLDEVSRDSSLRVQLREKREAGEFPPAYLQHRIVQDNPGERVWPIALYCDAVPYTQNDSVLGWWIYNMVSNVRHLFFVLRKRSVCSCGCQGWCSYHQVFSFLRWTLQAMAWGRYPERKHDGTPWSDSSCDRARAAKAGQPTNERFALVYVKGDWSEYCGTFGFPSWASSIRPCLYCNSDRDTWFSVAGLSPLSSPWRASTAADYVAACARCTTEVQVTRAWQTKLTGLLRYDHRSGGGRVLVEAVPELHLKPGDRLEPSDFVPDPSKFEHLNQYPFVALFWRRSEETLAKHKNPLFDDSIGTSPAVSMSVDALHCLHLGVLNAFTKTAIWKLLESNIWGALEATREDSLDVAVSCLRAELWTWYEQGPFKNTVTRVSDLTAKMLGGPSSHKLRTKGMETLGFFHFSIMCMERYQGRLDANGHRLLEAGKCMVRWLDIVDRNPTPVPPSAIQELYDNLKRHMTLLRDFNIFLPKHHQWMHLVQNVGFHGSPKLYQCFYDEHLNKSLKAACRHVHQANFEGPVLKKLEEIVKSKKRAHAEV